MPRIDTADCTVRHSSQGNTIGKIYREHLSLEDAITQARKGYHREGGKWDVRVKRPDGGTRVVESFQAPMWRLGPRTDHQSGIHGYDGYAWTAFDREIGGKNYRFVRYVSLWNHDTGIDVLLFNGKPNMLFNPPVKRFHWGTTFRR